MESERERGIEGEDGRCKPWNRGGIYKRTWVNLCLQPPTVNPSGFQGFLFPLVLFCFCSFLPPLPFARSCFHICLLFKVFRITYPSTRLGLTVPAFTLRGLVCVCTVRWTQYACVLYSFVLVVCTTPTVSINKEDELQHLTLLYTRENYPSDHTGTRGRQKKRKTKKKYVEETKAENRCNK